MCVCARAHVCVHVFMCGIAAQLMSDCSLWFQMILCSELSTVAVLENRNDINRSFVLWGSPSLVPTPVTSLLDNNIPKKSSSDGCYNGNHDNKGLASLVVQKVSEQKTRKLLAGVNDPPPGLSRIVPSSIPAEQSKDTAPVQSEDVSLSLSLSPPLCVCVCVCVCVCEFAYFDILHSSLGCSHLILRIHIIPQLSERLTGSVAIS